MNNLFHSGYQVLSTKILSVVDGAVDIAVAVVAEFRVSLLSDLVR